MIGSLHPMHTFFHHLDEVLVVAKYIGHLKSMTGGVEVVNNFPCPGGRSTLIQHSFYLLYHNMSGTRFHPIRTHTKVYSSREELEELHWFVYLFLQSEASYILT